MAGLINNPPEGSAVDTATTEIDVISGKPIIRLRISSAWLNFMNQVYRICAAHVQSGTTANRPTTGLWIGRPYYDTTLGYTVWVHQVSPSIIWHNGAGASV